MTTTDPSENDQRRLRSELGPERWDAIGHFLAEGDDLGFERDDPRAAIAQYEKAWALLSTPWQRATIGADILEGIASFAANSEDPRLAKETLQALLPRVEDMQERQLQAVMAELAALASGTT